MNPNIREPCLADTRYNGSGDRVTLHVLRRMNVQYVELTNYIAKQHGRY